MATADEVLALLDEYALGDGFPMSDNGYVYLAATRLSLHRSPSDWAMVIEVFGYSVRAGFPDVTVYTLTGSDHASDFFYPIDDDDWTDADDVRVSVSFWCSTSGVTRTLVTSVRATWSRSGSSMVLETGDVTRYQPPEPSNSHWRHWPEGGTL